MNSTVALEILQKWFTQWKCTEFPALFNHCHSMGVAEDFHINTLAPVYCTLHILFKHHKIRYNGLQECFRIPFRSPNV